MVYVADTSPNPAITSTAGIVYWNVGDLGPGQGGSFEVGLRLDALSSACTGGGISFTNSASIGSDQLDGNSANDSSGPINSGIIPCDVVDLVVVKNDGIGTGDPITEVTAGGLVTYTISVNNLGSNVATNVVLTETLPTNTSFIGPVGAEGWFQVARVTYTLSMSERCPASPGVWPVDGW